jgi:hypothetical protein
MDTQGTAPLLQTGNGYYYGTEKGGSWWKRYMKEGWFSRGNSEVWVTNEGIYFRRYLTKAIMHIPSGKIAEITLGKWHAGKWSGAPVIKVAWRDERLELESGFSISWDKEDTNRWISVLKGLIRQRG